MSYLKFDKEQLVNLEYSLNKEILRSNKAGAYTSTTIIGCNIRKYHGILVCPISKLNNEKHVLLSSLDETIIENGSEFNLGIRRYQGGIYHPRGHKYIRNIEFNQIGKTTYSVGSTVLLKEQLLVTNENQVLIKYTLEQAMSPVKLRLTPFLAFRNIHYLSKANLYANRKFSKVQNGIGIKMYEKHPTLFMQFSRKTDYVPNPDWYYNIEYQKELTRGFEYLEDLFVPGYFEIALKKGDILVFSAGIEEAKPATLKSKFKTEKDSRRERISFLSSLDNAASQFVKEKSNGTDIIAGFPWYDSITRQTFVALPGLCLSLGDSKSCLKILETYLKYLKNGFFPDCINNKTLAYNMADAPLWFIWTLAKYYRKNLNPRGIWEKFGAAIKEILQAYKKSSLKYVGTMPNDLVYAQKENTPLTWMNASVDGVPVVQRKGLPVEINALWYNAVCFALELAEKSGDTVFVENWKSMPVKIGNAFVKTFWSEGHNLLADVITDGRPDWSIRPNMVIAIAMDYSPLSIEQKKSVLDVATNSLLTKRGLRTLSPNHLRYKPVVEGGPNERELAIHQGAVWPWLIQFYIEAYLKIHKQSGLQFVKNLLLDYEDDLTEHCIGTMSEMYNGNPPHRAKGAVSQAWSVAALVYSKHLVQNYHEK